MKVEYRNLIDIINKNDFIIIAKHASPDWDTQGCALALKEIILDNFKNKKIYIVGEQLNLGIRDFDEKELNQEIIKKSLLISVDVANFERIDFEFKDQVKEIFKIDHHLEIDDFAKNKLVDISAIACTQIITIWANEMNLKISKKAATFLYYGLVTDSGRFLFNKVNSQTFYAAQILIKRGININEVYNSLYLRTLEITRFHFDIFNKAIFSKNNEIAYIKLTRDFFEKTVLGEEEIKSCLNVLSGIKEVKIWFLAYESVKNENIKISLRSREFDVNHVAKMYNGGGHRLASGAKIKNWDDLENLVGDLEKLINLEE
ncbi:DHH family phosphoesterase [Spiroplasma taiwanense]|uniref:DHH family protein n=1 Tax=Spiroplasma taiwanense CT-1 TaxID=1276220 RepID=S5LYL1_9MOLU|nr:bifunctional oligoribonuclease/PAP phosphatase NrnA [Spiroplasma taiwanense]AGR41646.1 DHH family protein [Spiroplasma taiwanense CT-1]